MYYLNYYVHPQPKTTEEEMIKEYERTRYLIVSKKFNETELTTINLDKILKRNNALNYAYNKWYALYCVCNRALGGPTAIQEHANMYTTFRIPKQTGGYRTITAPIDELKTVQQELLKLLTDTYKILPNNAAHGCVKHRNCLTSLKVHQTNKSRYFLKLDLHDAFGSVQEEQLKQALNKVVILKKINSDCNSNTITHIVKMCTNNCIAGLPQGAPTSPFMLNIYLQTFDDTINTLLRGTKIVYTRYVDDLLFSSKYPFDANSIIEYVTSCLPDGMTINDAKTRYGNWNWSNWNLGIMYNNEGRLTVGYKNKKLIKNRIHNYKTKPELRTTENYMQLNGLVHYYKYIEPEYFSREQFSISPPSSYN